MSTNWNRKNIARAKIGALAVIVLAFGGFGGWAATAPITGAVIASGVVKVLSNRKAVQHREGGIISEILVRDGDRVAIGDVVIRLDATRAQNSYNLLRSRRDHVLTTIARLRAELQLKSELISPEKVDRDDPAFTEKLENQQKLLSARLKMLTSSQAMIAEQMAQLNTEVEGLEAKAAEQTFQILSISKEVADLQALFDKGLTPRARLSELEREAADLRGRRAEVTARIGAARRSIAEAMQQQSRIEAEYHERANRELSESQRQLSEIIEQLESAAHSLAHSEIRATASGVVVGLAVHTEGGIITPADVLLEILPERENLVVEAQIEVKDIDLIRPGQPVDVQFVSSKARLLDKYSAKLTYVSADSLQEPKTGHSFFIARARLNSDDMNEELAKIVQPGLAADLFIKTDARTPLQYLMAPLKDSVSRAWRED